ncbi:MAG: CHAT domain-containing protein [Proteobacteria bacterium]|nr:CHAT domain-containing protein [Pseudomonadota bacterium]
MNATIYSELLDAIHRSWKKLPIWFGGDAWRNVKTELMELCEKLSRADDTASEIAQQLLQLLDRAPGVRAQLLAEVARAEYSSNTGPRTRSSQHLMVRQADDSNASTVTRYADLLCPNRVWTHTPRFPVVLRLTAEQNGDDQSMTLQAEHPVSFHIDAPDFAVLNEREQKVVVPINADSPPVVFDLQPMRVGFCDVRVHMIQSGNLISTASASVEVTEYESHSSAAAQQRAPIEVAAGAEPTDYILYIAYDRHSSPQSLRFKLIDLRSGDIGTNYEPVQLLGNPREHAQTLYSGLSRLIRRSHSPSATDYSSIPDRLANIGRNMWSQLLPIALRDRYIREREEWRGRSLIVVSDEPYLPWELVWPGFTDEQSGEYIEDDGPWCITMRMSRWLMRSSNTGANPVPKLHFSVGSMAILAPTDSGLDHAQAECEFLREICRDRGVEDVSPRLPTYAQVTDMLRTASSDWIHCSSHGNRDLSLPNAPATLLLHNGESLTPDVVVGKIAAEIRTCRPAFVFNACDVGQKHWGLTHIEGWADMLIAAGAGLFLGPMWAVSDLHADRFSRILYRELSGGSTIGEAVRQARIAVRETGDSAWMAYTLYAHPNARITLGPN